jgi:hypothetical protein
MALCRRIEPLSTGRQPVCDTSRITEHGLHRGNRTLSFGFTDRRPDHQALRNIKLVKVTGVEPAASRSRTERSTKLSYTLMRSH